jgi:hypothetical protein
MYYRSNWPEYGIPPPFTGEEAPADLSAWQLADKTHWRWVCTRDEFESKLYGISACNLHLEIVGSDLGWLEKGADSEVLTDAIEGSFRQFLEKSPNSNAYVCTKVVPHEPLYQMLIDAGFEPVEQRSHYKTDVSQLKLSPSGFEKSVQYLSFAELADKRRDKAREQVLDICENSFKHAYGRHFTDDFLVRRVPGSTYILEAMKLNFEHVPMHQILLAVESPSDRVCGFSVLKEGSGDKQPHFRQLLSAVRRDRRVQGIYAGFNSQLINLLPQEAQLLNVTHTQNLAMRHAYQNTGRIHYADTVVLRRIFVSPTKSGRQS